MDKNLKFRDKIKNISHLSDYDEYSNFLKVHSLELKFMVPWSQYEESNYLNKRPHSEKKNSDDKQDVLNNKSIEFSGAE